jgi:ADP-glucose pyrophosphorylase
MKNIVFCIVLLTFLCSCKSRKAAISVSQPKSDTVYQDKIALVAVEDVTTRGFEFPIGGTLLMDGVEVTRIDSVRYLTRHSEKTVITTLATTFVPVQTTIDKSRTRIQEIDRSRFVNKEIDKSREIQKTTTKTKSRGMPWWIPALVLAAMAVFIFRKFLNLKPFG